MYTVNAIGYKSLCAWLRGVLQNNIANDDYALEKFADGLCAEYDDSAQDAQDQIVEVRGFYTRTGNPVTYRFDKATELDIYNPDDDEEGQDRESYTDTQDRESYTVGD